MLKQTYTKAKVDAIDFVLKPFNFQCSKCQEVRYCTPDDYRVESGEFCTPEDFSACPLVQLMESVNALADEMEYQNTFNGRKLLEHWK